ncbi:MAG: enoyl-CoA hydratase [Gammaproteobacteria bacterium]|jgi:2-(1,2-epoxy-1,2-dihydrophenyl)acetyl-CoA isomerase|nr:enoyl-CoA hydratase [Gammaproteobacteria bacterium]MBT7369312.1 enoyl-CoA hydratase [Gammaproteobacteria bacterium]
MSSTSVVNYSSTGPVATITLNRPESLNAMNVELMNGISDAMNQVEADKDIRVMVITGSGRGFCAGADLSAQTQNDRSEEGVSGADDFNGAVQAIYDCSVPTVAKVNGPVAGGGVGLALACDIVVAAKSAFILATFGPRLGIVPDLGTTWSLPRRAGRARALGMSLLGDRISAEQAEGWGLIWKAVEDDELDTEIDRITKTLSVTSSDAMTRIRQSIDAASVNSFSEQLDLEMVHQGVLLPRNMQEGATAFMEKREPVFKGRE